MTSGLRKIHEYSWLIIAIAIPILIFFSVKDLTILSSNQKKAHTIEETKKESIKSIENELIKVRLYANSIEIILKTTLKNASSVLYTTDTEGEKDGIIGQITHAGIYHFEIGELPKGIVLYDAIKKEIITKMLF
ncbi:MAG: hypothetical protein GKR88_01605 [Flavobacteriaceae bacterium]|nr:MAG: hypothetical protein GKR88_01605 [Flavobacteriaceae bacterium]